MSNRAAPASFHDVRGTWAEGWIAALASQGVMQGYANGTFGPDDHITRGQAAAFSRPGARSAQHLDAAPPVL